jgi:antitoxin PrlF
MRFLSRIKIPTMAFKNGASLAHAKTKQCKRITIAFIDALEPAMPTTLEVESTLTDRYQTTVPESIRRVLHLGKRDRIHYRVQPDGAVLISRAVPSEADPALGSFLNLLAQDIAKHPKHLQGLDASLVARIQSLVGEVQLDLDAPLPPEDA